MERKNKDFNYCFKLNKGLNLVEPNANLMNVYLRKSKSALNMLSAALEKDELEWILDTSYYAKYFAVYALFMKAGIKSEIHDCTIFALNELFAKEGLVDKAIYEELNNSKELRVDAVYYDKNIGREDILERAKITGEFCLNAGKAIENIKDKEISLARKKLQSLLEIKRGKK